MIRKKKTFKDKFTNETDEFSDLAIERQFVSDFSFDIFFFRLSGKPK